eukprot:186380_1
MAIKCSVKWESVSPCPSANTIQCVPTELTKENYIVIERNTCICIYKYNFQTDTWSKMMNKPSTIYPNLASIDTKKKELWMYDAFSLAQIQLHGNYHCNTVQKRKYTGVIGKGVFINNSFHIIGGSNNNCIIYWNSKNKQFTNV